MDEDVEPATVMLVALAELRGVRPDAWTEGTRFDLAVRLSRTDALLSMLHEARGWMELMLSESMESDEEVVPAVGVLHREEKSRSKWRYPGAGDQLREDLTAAVARTVATDVATGELDPMKRNVVIAAMRTAYEAIPSFSSLKVAGQRRLSLDMKDYRTEETYYGVRLEEAL